MNIIRIGKNNLKTAEIISFYVMFNKETGIILLLIEKGNAVIKINGKIADSGENIIKARLADNRQYIIEALYPEQNVLPATVRFTPDEVFQSVCSVLTRYSRETFSLKFLPQKTPLCSFLPPVSQIKYRQGSTTHTATLYYDGIYFIEVENENSIYKRKIDDGVKNVVLKTESAEGKNFAALYGELDEKKYCLFITCDDDYSDLLYIADCVTIDKDIMIKICSYDMCRHIKEIILSFDGKTFSEKDKKIYAELPVKNIPQLLPYYFLEALSAEDYDGAISLLDKDNYKDVMPVQLTNFFGDYTDVLQNSYDRELAKYPAVKRKISHCYYELKYYDFKTQSGVIENIIEIGN